MSLKDYVRKRDFQRTPEPADSGSSRGRPMFVVQLHHASRRHYDFRLQVGGTLKSWAVPKGPSYDPNVKRMAVEVEDHPLDYASFEGEIPKGQYGGGHVALFDRGTWSSEADIEAQLVKGHLEFELFGERLKGGWHLIRTHKPARQPQWLLVKAKDAYASSLEADDLLDGVTPAPAADVRRAGAGKTDKAGKRTVTAKSIPAGSNWANWSKRALSLTGAKKSPLVLEAREVQLAKLYDAPPAGEDWLHEIKWDGYRLLAMRDGDTVRIWSRNALPWEDKVPELRDALLQLPATSLVLDGELIAGRGTREDFNLLQRVLSGESQGVIGFVAFDLLYADGVDIAACALEDRKALLADILAQPPKHLSYSSHGIGHGETAFQAATDAGFEGIISKRLGQPYRGGRSDQWRKAKALDSEEFAVVGYTPPKGSRRGIGSLLLATPDAQHGWRYVGRTGSGIGDALLRELGERFGSRGTSTPTIFMPEHDTDLRAAKWLEPEFVVEVFVRGQGGSGLLRQASFKTLREDKTPDDLRKEAKLKEAREPTMAAKKTKDAGKKAAVAKTQSSSSARELPAISSGEKLLFPEDNIRKQQVVDYYLTMMDWLLPEISGRPVSVIRCPGGIAAQCFFQKHATPGMELVSLVPLKEASGGAEDYIVATDAASVIELVQFNTIEFHPWGAKAETPDLADYLVFDLDPSEQVAWPDVVAAARQVRDLLAQVQLQSFVRTSGGKGLHVVVPLSPAVPWETAKPFAQAFAESLSQLEPLRYIATASKKFRKGKIFVDWLRNGRGATSVASFSLRARAGAPVAMPLRWEELGRVKSGAAFDSVSAPKRMKRMKNHPWGDYTAIQQTLPSLG